MDIKNKEINLGLKVSGFEGSLVFKNYNSRVIATLGDILIDKLNFCRWNNALRFLDKYNEIKNTRTANNQDTPLPPKYLFEILENAFLEDDISIQELWAKLPVNWQDSSRRSDMRPVYIDILKSLSPAEAKILKVISNNIEDFQITEINFSVSKTQILEEVNLKDEEYTLSMLNLFRCMCVESEKKPFLNLTIAQQNPVFKDYGLELVKPTVLGIKLMYNCIID